jgi:hypothetical protein
MFKKIFISLFINFKTNSSNFLKKNNLQIFVKPILQEECDIYKKITQSREWIEGKRASIRNHRIYENPQVWFLEKLKEKHNFLKINGIYIENKEIKTFNNFERICIGYLDHNNINGEIYSSIAIDSSYQNYGIGTLAKKIFINCYREDLKKNGFLFIKSLVKTNNYKSIRMLEKNGFDFVLDEKGEKKIFQIETENNKTSYLFKSILKL